MGLPPSLLIPLLVLDIGIDILLTTLFIYFLLQMIRFRGGFTSGNCPMCRILHKLFGGDAVCQRPQTANSNASTAQLVSLIKRSLVGTFIFPPHLNYQVYSVVGPSRAND